LDAVADREGKAGLRANAGDARLEVAERCAGTAVAGELLEEVADDADMDVFACAETLPRTGFLQKIWQIRMPGPHVEAPTTSD
jgi:hypothetical protein